MQVTVEYAAQIKRVAGTASETVEVGATCTVQELVKKAVANHGEALGKILLDSDGELQRSLLVFVGETQARWDDQIALKDGDTVTLLSPISGG
jgi:molybdopterin converting factor small subunit